MKSLFSLPAAAAAAFVLTMATAAHAGDRDTCAAGSEYAQRLLKQGRLIEARDQLLICTRMECPAIVKQDCDGWLSSLEATMPSLVVAARDEDGHDLLGTRVTLDGVVVDALNGRAIPVDPGVHKLRVEAEGKFPSEQRIVVREGERARPVNVTLLATARPPAPAPPPEKTSPAPTSPLVYVLGTLAGVSLASFAVFEIKASTDAAHLRSTCAPRCDPSDVDRVSTDTVIANVSLVLGAALAGGAVAVWYLGRKGPSSATALEVGPNRVGFRAAF